MWPNEIHTTEMHTCGEPLRIVEYGFPNLEASTLLGKRREVVEKYDNLRKMLMSEPRGHQDMYGAILTQSEFTEANFAVLFTHNEGLSTMCGHGVIALGRYAVDKKLVSPPTPEQDANVCIHCPCGLVKCTVSHDGSVAFCSVPAFVMATDVKLTVEGYGTLSVDVAYGGAFYAIIDTNQVSMDLTKASTVNITNFAMTVKKSVSANVELSHPDSTDLCYIYGVILTAGNDEEEETHHIIVFADGQLDRSPCGSGTTARMALQYFKQQAGLQQNKIFHNSKVKHSTFSAMIAEETSITFPAGQMKLAVVVKIRGKAHYTGKAVFTVEQNDPLKTGFLL